MRYEKENIYFVQMVRQAKKPVKTPKWMSKEQTKIATWKVTYTLHKTLQIQNKLKDKTGKVRKLECTHPAVIPGL